MILPVYNGELFIAQALQSLLNQTHPARQIIVIDDGSTDRSARIAGEFGGIVQVIRSERRGAWAARNLGVRAALGEYLIFHDADDIAHPERIAHQVRALQEESVARLVFGQAVQFSGLCAEVETLFSESHQTAKPSVCCAAFAVSRMEFERIGSFPENGVFSSFVDWMMRAQDVGAVPRVLPQTIIARRSHSANSTRVNVELLGGEYLGAIRSGLQRRKRSAP